MARSAWELGFLQPTAEARSAKVSERSELPLGTKKFTNATQCRGARSTGREMGTPSPLRALVLVIALLAWPTGTAEPTAPAPFLVSVDTPAPARAILAVGADGWDVAPDGWNASLVKIRYAVRAWPTCGRHPRATAASTHRAANRRPPHRPRPRRCRRASWTTEFEIRTTVHSRAPWRFSTETSR